MMGTPFDAGALRTGSILQSGSSYCTDELTPSDSVQLRPILRGEEYLAGRINEVDNIRKKLITVIDDSMSSMDRMIKEWKALTSIRIP